MPKVVDKKKKAVPVKKVTKKKVVKEKTKAEIKEGNSTLSQEFGIEKSRDVPWNDKKVLVFRGLKKCGAVSKDKAVSVTDVVEAGNKLSKNGIVITDKNVRHYTYCAKVSGLTDVAKNAEGIRGHGYHLTAKGAKVDPIAELKHQSNGKA